MYSAVTKYKRAENERIEDAETVRQMEAVRRKEASEDADETQPEL